MAAQISWSVVLTKVGFPLPKDHRGCTPFAWRRWVPALRTRLPAVACLIVRTRARGVQPWRCSNTLPRPREKRKPPVRLCFRSQRTGNRKYRNSTHTPGAGYLSRNRAAHVQGCRGIFAPAASHRPAPSQHAKQPLAFMRRGRPAMSRLASCAVVVCALSSASRKYPAFPFNPASATGTQTRASGPSTYALHVTNHCNSTTVLW